MRETNLTCLIVPAAHDELDHFVSVERVLLLHNAERGQTPVYRVHPQVRGEMVDEVIFVLEGVV